MAKVPRKARTSAELPQTLEGRYPSIAAWVRGGWIEIGVDYDRSFVRAFDSGGLVWEGKSRYRNLDEALKALDAGIG